MPTVIWWIRRDLRLHDNQALARALRRGDRVIPVFVLDPNLLEGPSASPKRNAFLFAALRALDHALRQRGSQLVVRSGDPVAVLEQLVVACGASAVIAEADVTPYARGRDAAVARRLPLELTPGLTLLPVGTLQTPNGAPFTRYTPFARAFWQVARSAIGEPLAPPPRFPPCPPVPSDPIPEVREALPAAFPPSETDARRHLATFLSNQIAVYDQRRHLLDGSGSSHLSPYLRFGLLSVREAWSRALPFLDDPEARAGTEAWLAELVWREFYQHLLAAFPESVHTSLQPSFRSVTWPGSTEQLRAWQEGRTGYPVIDAAMRQLAAEGWLSNRARLVVANFLTKLLLADWRAGERWFRQRLLDGDVAANVGNWQWAAGTGTDAAPYIRIFNPVTQGQQYDPTGAWIRRWVPELTSVPPPYLFAPWTMPESVQRAAGCRIGRDYPAPLVAYETAREHALAWFRAATRPAYDGASE